MKEVVIGLYGIGGVYNFGCEAIVRGATKLINNLYENPKIIYFSKNYDYDMNTLSDLEIEIVNVEKRKGLFQRGINRIYRMLGIEHRLLLFDYKMILSSVDEIWSIGGDIYTIPKYKRETRKYEYYNELVDFCEKAVEAGKKVVLYGASVGPFGDYHKAVSYYIRNLSRYDKILCREYESLEYLKMFGLNNVRFFPDPAFQVQCNDMKTVECKKTYIGLNLSPLSLNEIYGNCNSENKEKLIVLIKKIMDSFPNDLLLIPHVISKNKNDDDLVFLKAIKNEIGYPYINRIKMADFSKGFLGLKSQICECKYIVAARMHCAINAIAENVPAIMLSYSSKSIGMSRYIYGDEKFMIKIDEIEEKLIPTMRIMEETWQDESEFLCTRNIEMEKEYRRLLVSIKDEYTVKT